MAVCIAHAIIDDVNALNSCLDHIRKIILLFPKQFCVCVASLKYHV